MAYFDKYGVEFSDDRKTLVKCPKDVSGKYIIPFGVETIGKSAFRHSSIHAIDIPDSITYIEDGAFWGCENIRTLSIPDSVIKCGANIFYYCHNIQGAIYNKYIFFKLSTSFKGIYTIPDGLNIIAGGAFSECQKLTSVIIPHNIKHIGRDAFAGCFALEFVNLPQGIDTIEEMTFIDCVNLTKIILPESLCCINDGAFERCCNLRHLRFSKSITNISDGAFYDCDSLKEIVVPSGQKERFMKMNALSDYKDIIIDEDQRERIRASQSMDAERIRVWEECVAEWEKCKQGFKSNKAIYDMIEAGSVPASFPPIGVCLTTAEYNQFKSEKRDLQKIQGWCYSGKNFHATVRLFSHFPNGNDSTGVGNMIGLKTPRKGFYRVIDVLDDNERTLVCYYNYHDSDEFVEEEVEISSKPLYNKASIGPKDHLLRVGDILHVKEDVQLVEAKYEGEIYTAYKIVWDYEK